MTGQTYVQTPTGAVLSEVFSERLSQDQKWGEQNHPNGTGTSGSDYLADYYREVTNSNAREGKLTYRDILLEEVYEALAEQDRGPLREELIQVAAVAVAWVEKIDRDRA